MKILNPLSLIRSTMTKPRHVTLLSQADLERMARAEFMKKKASTIKNKTHVASNSEQFNVSLIITNPVDLADFLTKFDNLNKEKKENLIKELYLQIQ